MYGAVITSSACRIMLASSKDDELSTVLQKLNFTHLVMNNEYKVTSINCILDKQNYLFFAQDMAVFLIYHNIH
jgi:hypothetical protein